MLKSHNFWHVIFASSESEFDFFLFLKKVYLREAQIHITEEMELAINFWRQVGKV
jgi:hypothetical protein